jgi:hypothetical protein
MALRYRANAPQVISETVGGETIIVNLATGHYFNLQGTAVDVWQAIERGEPLERIVAGLGARYEAADGEIDAAVATLVEELVAAELLAAEDGDGAAEPSAGPVVADGDGAKAPWAAPGFAAFTDMQDIILLDPVHEVDARGWPHAPAGA